MVITTDVSCRGESWYQIDHRLKDTFFKSMWEAFKLSVAIGILYDRAKKDISDNDDKVTISRNMFIQHAEEISYFFKTAIITSNLVDFSEKDRLYLAFSEDVTEEELESDERDVLIQGVSEDALSFDKAAFLKGFANYGADRLAACISSNDNETMENLMDFLNDSYNGETEELLQMREINEDFDVEFDDEVIES